jgi:hypothetical protein
VLAHTSVPIFYFRCFGLLPPLDAGLTTFSARYAAIARRIDSASGVPCSAFNAFSPASRSSGMKTATRRIQVSMYACRYLHVKRTEGEGEHANAVGRTGRGAR